MSRLWITDPDPQAANGSGKIGAGCPTTDDDEYRLAPVESAVSADAKANRGDAAAQASVRTPVSFEPVVSRCSYFFVGLLCVVHIWAAAIVACMITTLIWGSFDRAFYFMPFFYITFVGLTVYLVFRQGYWTVDGKHIYQGWKNRPVISAQEIVAARIGLPDSWISSLAKLPGQHHARSMQRMQKDALLLQLTGNRWFIWKFPAMVNEDNFVKAVLSMVPPGRQVTMADAAANKLTVAKAGKILKA